MKQQTDGWQPNLHPKTLLRKAVRSVLSSRTVHLVRFDLHRTATRIRSRRSGPPPSDRLQLGSGERRINGWLNVDLKGSDWDVDLAAGSLPWPDASFRMVLTQHTVEHLEIDGELLPLLHEVHRVMHPQGVLVVSCPDISKICRSYVDYGMSDLLKDRQSRFPDYNQGGKPDSHLINHFFHQGASHRNLFDFDLLFWALDSAGFSKVELTDEDWLVSNYPEVPRRHDGLQTLYVKARP